MEYLFFSMSEAKKKTVKIAASSLNQLPLDWEGNLANIVNAIEKAKATGVSLICFPELCIPGYGCEDMFFAEFVQDKCIKQLFSLLPQTVGLVCSVGLPLVVDQKLYNACALIADGKLLGFSCKRFLAKDGVYYEPRWFTPWNIGTTSTVNLLGAEYPVGDFIFDLAGTRIAFEICEDAWATSRYALQISHSDVDIVLNPSASHFAFGKEEMRIKLSKEGSTICNSAYVYSNLLGNDAGRLIYDGSRIITQNGELVAHGKRFTFNDNELTWANIEIKSKSPNSGALKQVDSKFEFPASTDEISSKLTSEESLNKEEELYQSVALGLHDYLRKSRSRGFVISLSGGVDSAAVASLAVASIKEAANQLGFESLKSRFSYWPEVKTFTSIDEFTKLAVTCVYQSTENSGTITRNAATSVAKEIGSSFLEFDLSKIVDSYLGLLSQNPNQILSAGLPSVLGWEKHDVPLQNIQARTRGPGVWLIANLKGALLLATSNRSEASVGYTTMDGDTCGGLSPIAGVDKAYLRKWLVWLEKVGPKSMRKISALSLVNEQAPTAELRPAGDKQTDEADLMPYDVLDRIERLSIRDKKSPQEVLNQVQPEFPNYSREQMKNWVTRFHRLWSQNQWKRERYAPSFHLDDESVDPKTWCRFPILSSGYSEELRLLK